jgi:hypothetical protein
MGSLYFQSEPHNLLLANGLLLNYVMRDESDCEAWSGAQGSFNFDIYFRLTRAMFCKKI